MNARRIQNVIRIGFLLSIPALTLGSCGFNKTTLSNSSALNHDHNTQMDSQPLKSIVHANGLSYPPRLVFVIDDIGYTKRYKKELEKFRFNVTYSILPKLPYRSYFNEMSGRTGAEVILHLPLRAQSGQFPGPGLLTSKMTEGEILRVLDVFNFPYSSL
jgi:polysaccharide deacetylase 2 family uncharacterized protein YibQ